MTDRPPFDPRAWGTPPPAAAPTPPAAPPNRTLRTLLTRPGRRTTPDPVAHGTGFGGPTGTGSTPPPARRPRRPVRALTSLLVAGAVGVGAAVLLHDYVAQPFRVPSASMHPTLQEGDQIVAEKLSYLLGTPRRGQVIVFDGAGTYDEPGTDPTYYVKRVIAVGGDTIECCDKKRRLLVNGSPVLEPYLAGGPGKKFRTRTVPDGELFVMGDNRANSLDSRWLGTVNVDKVVGHVFARTWPPKRIHTVDTE